MLMILIMRDPGAMLYAECYDERYEFLYTVSGFELSVSHIYSTYHNRQVPS